MHPRRTGPTRSDFEEIYRHYRRSVHRQAQRLIGDYHEAEDASQEIFLRIYTGLATLKNGDARPLWVKRIARNTAIDLQRRRRRIRLLPLAHDVPGPDVPGQDVPGLGADPDSLERLLPDLVTALEKLPLTLGVTLLLFAIESLGPSEISDLTCTNPGNVKVRLHRARSLLSQKWRGLRRSRASHEPIRVTRTSPTERRAPNEPVNALPSSTAKGG